MIKKKIMFTTINTYSIFRSSSLSQCVKKRLSNLKKKGVLPILFLLDIKKRDSIYIFLKTRFHIKLSKLENF